MALLDKTVGLPNLNVYHWELESAVDRVHDEWFELSGGDIINYVNCGDGSVLVSEYFRRLVGINVGDRGKFEVMRVKYNKHKYKRYTKILRDYKHTCGGSCFLFASDLSL